MKILKPKKTNKQWDYKAWSSWSGNIQKIKISYENTNKQGKSSN